MSDPSPTAKSFNEDADQDQDQDLDQVDDFFGGAGAPNMLFCNAPHYDENRQDHRLLVAVRRSDVEGVVEQLKEVETAAQFEAITDLSQNNALHVAAMEGNNATIVKKITEYMSIKGCSVLKMNAHQDTALHLAVTHNNIAVSTFLTHYFQSEHLGVNQVNSERNTALMISIINRNLELFELLLPLSKLTWNARNIHCHSILHLSCFEFDPNGELCNHETTLSAEEVAARSITSLEMTKIILYRTSIRMGLMDKNGKGVFHLACELGNSILVQVLLERCKTNCNNDPTFESLFLNHPVATVIEAADEEFNALQTELEKEDSNFVSEGFTEVKSTRGTFHGASEMIVKHVVVPTLRASWLITGDKSAQAQKGKKKRQSEARFKQFSDYHRTPIHLALLNGHRNVVTMLLAEPALNKDALDDDGNNCAHFAAMSGNCSFFNTTIICHFAHLCEKTDNIGNFILHKASIHGNCDIVDEIVDTFRAMDMLHRMNLNNETVLHTAARAGNLALVEHYVTVYHLNVHSRLKHDKYTALHLATAHKHDDVMEFLLNHGADANCKNRNTMTPLRMVINKCESKQDAVSRLSLLIDHGADVFIKKSTNDQALKILKYVADFPSVEEAQSDPVAFDRIKKEQQVPFCLILLLKFLDQPYLFLSNYFDKLLFRLHETCRGPHLVGRLVVFSLALKICIQCHPLESLYLQRRFDMVEHMIVKIMETAHMDVFQEFVYVMCLDPFRESNVTVAPNLKLFYKREDISHLHCTADAKILIYSVGPLSLCIDHELSALCGAVQVATICSDSFWDHIRESCNHTLLEYVSMKSIKYSQDIDIRSRPVFMFILEFLSNVFTLLLAAGITNRLYQEENYVPQSFQTLDFLSPEFALVVMIITNLLYEFGEIQDADYDIGKYFGEGEMWNKLDFLKMLMYLGWLISKMMGDAKKYHLLARGFLSLACIPASVNLLRYLSIFQFYGVLVIMLVKVGVDTIKYITIFFFCSFGFGLCYMGLFPEIYNFSQSSLTAFSMFDFAVGNFNQTIFDDSPYEHVGKILTVIFVVITLIIIFNLLIARMADTYAKIDEKAFYQWAKAMAKNGRSFMLLQERSPFSMLPPPFNVIPALVYPIHFWSIRRARKRISKSLLAPKRLNPLSTRVENGVSSKKSIELGRSGTENGVSKSFKASLTPAVYLKDFKENYYTLSIAGTLSDWILNSLCIPVIFTVGVVVRLIEFTVKYFKLSKGVGQKLAGLIVAVPFVTCYSLYYAFEGFHHIFTQKCYLKFDKLAKDKFLNVKHSVKHRSAQEESDTETSTREMSEQYSKNKANNELLNSSKAMKLNLMKLPYTGMMSKKNGNSNMECFTDDDMKHIFAEALPSRYPSDTDKADADMMEMLKALNGRLTAADVTVRKSHTSRTSPVALEDVK